MCYTGRVSGTAMVATFINLQVEIGIAYAIDWGIYVQLTFQSNI